MRPFFNFFVHFEVRGLENLGRMQGPIIFAPNHSHGLDSELLPLALPLWGRFSPVFFVIREPSYYKHPAFGWLRFFYSGLMFKMLGAIPLISGVKDYATSLVHHEAILNDGGSVCIFPEGKISKTRQLGKAHGGVGYLAHKTGCSIVPVLIDGTFGLSFADVLFRRANVVVEFLAPIAPKAHLSANPTIDEYRAIAETALDAIKVLKRQAYMEHWQIRIINTV